MRKWNFRKICIILVMSNSPISAFASDHYLKRCICGQDLYQSAKIKFMGYKPTLEQRVKKLEKTVFSEERNYVHT